MAADVNGNFTITLNEQRTNSYFLVGCKRKGSPVWKPVTIILEPEEAQLDEVVVTGYQSINRRDMVGSTRRAANIMMPGTPYRPNVTREDSGNGYRQFFFSYR
ncbi:MAG: hypothetical protein ACLU4J_24820 [Butyricimonas paravirosa]